MSISNSTRGASTRRTYVMAHCHTADSARACIAAGVRSIEHGSDFDEETAKMIAAAGSFVVPTLVVADTALRHDAAMGLKAAKLAKLEGIAEKMYRSIELCLRQGVKLGLGTDLPGNFGDRQNGDPTRDISVLAEAAPSLIMARGSLVKNILSA